MGQFWAPFWGFPEKGVWPVVSTLYSNAEQKRPQESLYSNNVFPHLPPDGAVGIVLWGKELLFSFLNSSLGTFYVLRTVFSNYLFSRFKPDILRNIFSNLPGVNYHFVFVFKIDQMFQDTLFLSHFICMDLAFMIVFSNYFLGLTRYFRKYILQPWFCPGVNLHFVCVQDL